MQRAGKRNRRGKIDDAMEAIVYKLFRDTAEDMHVQVLRYVLAGTAAYIVDYAVLIFYVEFLKIHYLPAAAAAFLFGAAISYVLSIFWVFGGRRLKSVFLEASLFFSLVIVGLSLNHFCMWFFTGHLGNHYLLSKALSTAIVSAVNFSSRKYILFR
jgi:putative flippase GtrA